MQTGHSLTRERTPEEVLVLEMLGNIAESIGSEFGAKAKALFSKLKNTTPNPIYSKTIIEDISDKLEHFHILERAIAELRMVCFSYNGKLRHVHPYKIVSFEGYWYLYGEEFMEGKLKTFYFKGIDHIELTPEIFEPNDAAYRILERAINVWFEPDKEPFEVTLRAFPEIAKYFLRRPLSFTQRIVKTYLDGSMDITVSATSSKEILQEVKKWIPDLIITSPSYLAIEAKAIADSFLNRQFEHLIR